jgi:hypothetical protein
MALPVGQISLSQVNTELGISPSSTVITMNDAAVRTLAGVGGSGTVISMSNLQGKSNTVAIPLTISGNTYNYDVYTNRGPTYSPGNSNITVTINPGVTVGSTSTGTFALTVPSAFSPTDNITIVNNGTIVGRGGNGGAGSPTFTSPAPIPAVAGGGGGTALRILRPTTITNNGTIGGGGGGGGGGGRAGPVNWNSPEGPSTVAFGGAGAGGVGGGGAGFDAGSPNGSATSGGGGAGGTTAQPQQFGTLTGGTGGAGGARGSAGSTGQTGQVSGVAGPITQNFSQSGAGGGAAGAYISGLPFATFPVTGTRLGPSS